MPKEVLGEGRRLGPAKGNMIWGDPVALIWTGSLNPKSPTLSALQAPRQQALSHKSFCPEVELGSAKRERWARCILGIVVFECHRRLGVCCYSVRAGEHALCFS